MKRELLFAVGCTIALAGCSASHPKAVTWPGTFYPPNSAAKGNFDFYDQPTAMTDLKILCSQGPGGLTIRITGPDGTQVASTRREDGSAKADIHVTGGNRDPQTPTDNAVWISHNGEWGFEQDPDNVDAHHVFNLRGGAALCPVNH